MTTRLGPESLGIISDKTSLSEWIVAEISPILLEELSSIIKWIDGKMIS